MKISLGIFHAQEKTLGIGLFERLVITIILALKLHVRCKRLKIDIAKIIWINKEISSVNHGQNYYSMEILWEQNLDKVAHSNEVGQILLEVLKRGLKLISADHSKTKIAQNRLIKEMSTIVPMN